MNSTLFCTLKYLECNRVHFLKNGMGGGGGGGGGVGSDVSHDGIWLVKYNFSGIPCVVGK